MATSPWVEDAFKRARDDFLKTLKNPSKYDFSKFGTIEAVYDEAQKIQEKQTQTRTLRGAKRIEPFINGLKEYAATIEVFVQAKPEILCLLWGPLKFLLQLSSSLIGAFERVVKVLGDMGHSLPQFQKYTSIFPENDAIKQVMCLFYVEILQFYKILLDFLENRRLNIFLESLWPNIRGKLDVVQKNIGQHQLLMTSHVTLEHVTRSSEAGKRALREYDKAERDRTIQTFRNILTDVSPPMYHDKLASLLQESTVESGSWLEREPSFSKWLDPKDTSSRCIWVKGIPGSGKTFFVANTIRRLRRIHPQVLFVFLAHENQDHGEVIKVFQSFVFQAVGGNPALMNVLNDQVHSKAGDISVDRNIIKDLLLNILKSGGLTLLVVDGLDELEERKRDVLLGQLLDLVDGSQTTRLLISSRDERDISKTLQGRSVSFRVDHHNRKAQDYDLEEDEEVINPALVPQRGDRVWQQESALVRQPESAGVPSTAIDSGYASMVPILTAPSQDHKTPSQNLLESAGMLATTPPEHNEITYSTASSLGNPGTLISEFVQELYNSLPANMGRHEWERLSPSLADMLMEFALRIGYSVYNAEPIEDNLRRKTMYLVHKHHEDIITCLGREYEDEPEVSVQQTTSGGMSFEEKLAIWNSEPSADNEGGGDPPEQDINLADDDEPDFVDVARYKEALTRSPVYHWLISRIQRQNNMADTGTNLVDGIRHRVLQTLGLPDHISRRSMRDFNRQLAVFHIHWRPLEFFQAQEYDVRLEDALPRVITFAGDERNAQAAGCLEYTEQMWPTAGPHVLQFIKRLLANPAAAVRVEHTLPDKTTLSGELNPDVVHIYVAGSPYSIAEVAQQLAWLGGVLRRSGNEGFTCCTPHMDVLSAETHNFRSESTKVIHFSLHYSLEAMAQPRHSNGSCWVDMFKNPVMMKGYPIPRRPMTNTGLELSLGLLSALINGARLANFGGTTILKGFSAMLATSAIVDDTVFWHYFFNPKGQYISYADKEVAQSGEFIHVPSDVVERSRHIVGWCEVAKSYAGAKEASYDIKWSGLGKVSSKCAFQNISISAGKYVTIGTNLLLGIAEKPVHISFGDDYLRTLLMIDNRHFVIYDTDDRRAWLVRGASLILHILRASIRYDKKDRRLRSFIQIDEDDIVEATDSSSSNAFEVLSTESNLELPFYPRPRDTKEKQVARLGAKMEVTVETTSSYICLKDRVSAICHILGLLMGHQDDVSSENGVGFRLRSTPRRQLEGFDFMDLAAEMGTLWPKVQTLNHRGRGWVDFTRAIHAVTLFGRGFGDLIRPVEGRRPCHACHWHGHLPRGNDYLAMGTRELQEIAETSGDISSRPVRLIDGIYWYTPDQAFDPCHCSSVDHHDRVQVLLPKKLIKQALGGPNTGHLPTDGAVIFGHSKKYPVRWPPQGDPNAGEPDPDEDELMEDVLHDSGKGTSIDSSEAIAMKSPNSKDLYLLENERFIYSGRGEASRSTSGF